MDRYDENLADNKFLNCLKFQYKEIFEEAISSNWIICVPKSNIIKETTLNIILDHILNPIQNKENDKEEFISKMGKEFILHEGYFSSKTEDKFVNILFEETFYDSKLGKYKVVCLDNYLTYLFTDNLLCLEGVAREVRNRRPSGILKDLRSVNDFSDYIYKTTQKQSTIDAIDTFIAEFLSLPLSRLEYPKTQWLKDQVHEIFEKCIKDINEVMSESDTKILHISIESYIIHNVYKILFEASTLEMAQSDEKLNRVLHSIKDFNISNFDIKISNLNWILSAKYELAAMNSYKSPFGKLQCVKRSIECFETENILTSDELLPILVFCIIKCNLSNWFANLFFIKTFHFCIKINEEYEFILSSLEAALHYLQSGEMNKSKCKDFKSELLNKCNLKTIDSQLNTVYSKLQNSSNEILLSLHDKIRNNNVEAVKMLLEKEESPETFSNVLHLESQLCHPLCICAKCKDLLHNSYVQLIPCSVDSVDEVKMTLLHVAAMYGSINVVEYLLDKGANLESRNLSGQSPLHLAAYKGHQNILLLLLHSGCDITDVDNEGNTALHLACIAGHDSCVKALIFFAESMGLPIGFDCQNLCGDTPLHLASRWGYSSTVKLLLSQSSVALGCINIRNKRHQTPIDCAHNTTIASFLRESAISAENHNDISLLLLNFEQQNIIEENKRDHKFNLNDHKIFNKSQSISHEKSITDHKAILKKILKAIKVGDTKLAYFYLEINDNVSCLINYKTEMKVDKAQCHPLCQCSNCLTLTQGLPIKSNSSLINKVDENYGVLHAAVCSSDLEMCQILIYNGADPCILTRIEKQSCLHLAVTIENDEIMKLLIKCGADVNAVDIFGNTPIHFACIRGWKLEVILLINFGSILNKNNKNELTLEEEAYQNGHMEIVPVLI